MSLTLKKLQKSEAEYRAYMQEQISHTDVIKAFENEKSSENGLENLQNERMKLVSQKNRCNALMRFGINAVFSGSYLFAFVSGALQIASGSITFGTMTAFLSLVNQIQTPVLSLSKVFSQFIVVTTSNSRIMEIAGMQCESKEENSSELALPVTVCADKISFSYETNIPVISALSFEIPVGSFTAVMGPSGSGKITLVRILLEFLKLESGKIKFTGSDRKTLKCSQATRKFVSYVPQGNTLFSGTIAENLRLGCKNASRDEMLKALHLDCADFVKVLPTGLDTRIGEKAHGISEGQAQRIAIARALLRDAPIVILNEATSSFDEETERKILKNLSENESNKSYIVISHRKAVADYSDQIINL